jgi:hypothetical protein
MADFEDGSTTEWMGVTSALVTNSVLVVSDTAAAATTRSLQVGTTANPIYFIGGTTGAYHAFTAGQIPRVRFWGRVGSATSNSRLRLMSAESTATVVITAGFGTNGSFAAGTVAVATPYSANTWYQFEITLDWAARTYSVRVGGALVASNVAFSDAAAVGVGRVQVVNTVPVGGAMTSWWDEIVIE